MITYTEFFLFISLIVAIGYALHWKHKAYEINHLFKLMLTDSEANKKLVDGYREFKRQNE